MKIYAQVNEEGVCYAVSYLGDDVMGENIIRLEDMVPAGFNTHADYYLNRVYKDTQWAERFEPEPNERNGENDEL